MSDDQTTRYLVRFQPAYRKIRSTFFEDLGDAMGLANCAAQTGSHVVTVVEETTEVIRRTIFQWPPSR